MAESTAVESWFRKNCCTGLRIGLAAVKGLAISTGKPVAVPTLKALVWAIFLQKLHRARSRLLYFAHGACICRLLSCAENAIIFSCRM